ncbi:MAG: Monomeric sarcosine oxidase [Candidatus Moanabacter tarae]|uniref:Monomeric sarcosine oxidase n=1 Tax=Candidatus Moanibacter tarae TaxID=2200854 RepID=A0A2Z4ACZ4_9BACT|nr:MAG: Monomeric sarcosine oxidase [Candidatus Moanabacter tarae]|tara:strand:+ start:27216 stop:28352 length:1137 start_codon:yes stop_codon:yes gene_type:complete
MANHYDVIVLGVGGMGSSTLYHLAKRGIRACGIDRFEIAHDRGSSHGDTRIIRKAYMELPSYIPLLNRAYELWEQLEKETGSKLLLQTGLLLAGSPESEITQGLEDCYQKHELPHTAMKASEVDQLYPQLHLPEDWVATFDPFGGILRVEECVRQYASMARRYGANLYTGEAVLSWKSEGNKVLVETERRNLTADRLILTAGSWSVRTLLDIGIEIKILRKVSLWYLGSGVENYRREVFPCFCIGIGSGSKFIYGFPVTDNWGLKVAEHNLTRNEIDNPLKVNRCLGEEDEKPVLEFLGHFFPQLSPKRSKFTTCLYTMSPDENFIIDFHPEHENVVIAAGFSGHGFKFASVIGEVLVDLAVNGETKHPIEFLKIDRF